MFTLYVENFVKGLAKTTAGVLVLFVSYPLFILYDSYLNSGTSGFTEPTLPNSFSKLECESEKNEPSFDSKIKSTLDKIAC